MRVAAKREDFLPPIEVLLGVSEETRPKISLNH